MRIHDHVRRALTLVLVVACLVGLAGIAQARFSVGRSAGLSVSTASMVAPTSVTGNYQCRTGLFTEGISFTVTGFRDDGQPPGAQYRYEIVKNGGEGVGTTTSPVRARTLNSTMTGVDVGSTSYTLRITAVLKGWTSPTWTRTVSCGFLGSGSGTL